MSLTPDEQAEYDALSAKSNAYDESQQAKATFVDVAPYFYNNQLPNKLKDSYDYETDLSDYVPGPGFFTYAAPLVGALTPSISEKLMEDKKLYPTKDGKRVKGSDPIANPQKELTDARSVADADFENQKQLDLEELQQRVEPKRNALLPEINDLQNQIASFDENINDTKKFFNDAINRGDTIAMDWNANHLANLEAGKAQQVNRLNALNAELAGLDAQVNQAANTKMSAAQAIDIDTQALRAMGVEPPDVTKELEAGDIDGARKKMSDHLSNSAKSRMARLVDFTKQIKSGKQVLFDADGKFRPTKSVKGGVATGLGTGFLIDTAIDFFGNESINLEEEERIVRDLIDMAETYSSPLSGPDETLLDPKEQGSLIEDIESYYNHPSGKGYLLNANRPRKSEK